MAPAAYRVARRRRKTDDTWTLELEGPPLEIEPGQFTMLYVFGVGEVPISVSGDLTRPGALVQTIRSVGAVTQALCSMRAGDVVGVRGPMGNAWPVEEAAGGDVVIVAGGVGLAPVRPAFYHVLAHRDRYRRVALLVN